VSMRRMGQQCIIVHAAHVEYMTAPTRLQRRIDAVLKTTGTRKPSGCVVQSPACRPRCGGLRHTWC
jgi:hypothetical protein